MNKTRLVQLAGLFGLYGLARQITRHHPRILMYHRFSAEPKPGYVSATTFEQQVRHIARHHHPMTFGVLLDHLRRRIPLPPHVLVITVDDGYRDFYEIAWPILRRHEVPATFFVTTGFVDRELWLWPDQVSWLLANGNAAVREIEIVGHRIARDAATWQRIIDIMLAIPDSDKHQTIHNMAEQLRVPLPAAAPAEFSSVTWDQLREMEAAGVEIGGHTHTHPTLPQVAPDEFPRELEFCLARLNTELGERARPFCYPNGQPADYNPQVRAAVEAAGFTGAVVAYADHESHGDFYALRRHSSSECRFQFLKAESGLEWLGRRMKAWSNAG